MQYKVEYGVLIILNIGLTITTKVKHDIQFIIINVCNITCISNYEVISYIPNIQCVDVGNTGHGCVYSFDVITVYIILGGISQLCMCRMKLLPIRTLGGIPQLSICRLGRLSDNRRRQLQLYRSWRHIPCIPLQSQYYSYTIRIHNWIFNGCVMQNDRVCCSITRQYVRRSQKKQRQ